MLRKVLSCLTVILAFLTFAEPSQGDTPVRGPHSVVRLVAERSSVPASGSLSVGLLFDLEPNWHIYWKNPGDSGLPTRLTWKLPAGVKAGEIEWPYPERIALGPLMNFGYGGTVLLPMTLTAPAGKPFTASLTAKWLECHEECLPAEGTFTLAMGDGASELTADAPHFTEARKLTPEIVSEPQVTAEFIGGAIKVTVTPLDDTVIPDELFFFPEEKGVIEHAAPQPLSRTDHKVQMTLQPRKNREFPPEKFGGVLVAPGGWRPGGEPKAIYFLAAIDGVPKSEKSSTMAEDRRQAKTYASAAEDPGAQYGVIAAAFFAFIGGLILNLMPCVFPVLSLKILSFVEQSKGNANEARIHGLLFALGVLISFWVLGGLLLALRGSGLELGWGYQLQSPVFVVSLAFLFFFLGLSLFGICEIGLSVQAISGGVKTGSGKLGSFMSGVLATMVATPCTAPFMGPALAAALSLSSLSAMVVFSMIGVGMSLPYVVLSFNPALLRFLPRPGVWMETFKQFMAFPMFATTAWLISIYAQQMGMTETGVTILIQILIGLTILLFGAWVLGRWGVPYKSRAVRYSARAIGLAAMIVAVVYTAPGKEKLLPVAPPCPNQLENPDPDEHGLKWYRYSSQRLDNLLKEGKSVYLDFTAAWCLTCQVNKRLVFGNPEVASFLREHEVMLLKGDWTSMDSEITNALKRFGRSGVPVNVIYGDPKKGGEKPTILPSILTPGLVLDALRAVI